MARITFTIPDEKLAEFRAAFLKIFPNDELDSNGNPYTDNQWIGVRLKQLAFNIYENGRKAIARETTPVVVDQNIISVS